MKTYIFAASLACIFLLGKTSPAKKTSPRILGGSQAHPGQFPWQVAIKVNLLDDQMANCGGSLIAPEWVLTAAHCVHRATKITLHFGGVLLDPNEEGKVTVVSKCHIVHPDFKKDTLINDIALIRLPEPLNITSRISPVALPDAKQTVGPGVGVTISGWGTKNDSRSLIATILDYFCGQHGLYYAALTTISNTACAEFDLKPETITSSTLCVRSDKKHNSCKGDDGGPVVTYDDTHKATLVAVISLVSSEGCAEGFPSRFVRTAPYRGWIKVYAGI